MVLHALLYNECATAQCVRNYWGQNKCTTILGCVPNLKTKYILSFPRACMHNYTMRVILHNTCTTTGDKNSALLY